MSNSIFGNPKIALGFAGGVVAIALVASLVLNEYKPGAQPAAEPVASAPVPEAAPTAPAEQGFADGTGAGWGDAGGGDAGWGAAPAPRAASQKPSFTGPSAADPFADLGAMDNAPTRNAGGRRRDSAGGPTITSSAAPNAPAVEPPGGESRGTLNTTG
ncbi:hypothetical protein INR77_00610 [Erythrobacter sp. SCSIO 43205]|uniref:hypothetical protein n=1 Tax=Erythrobacter sp. SCSIO 43205 TaxID=2779361 RepID=UPI001CA9293B|nr:hypothetical protein [Erythrobacter sp. SCSIO 43205]UAB78292.1 hypothetical protein INR77_00610 [Erythrobacter sp. SCSIO 43205]